MIAEDGPVGSDELQAPGSCTRRDFLALLATGCVLGVVTGSLTSCGGGDTSARTAPPPPPTPFVPASRITLENAAKIAMLATLQPMDGRVRGVAWSPDGRLVATGSQQEAQL